MSKRLVRFCHSVRLFFLFESAAGAALCIDDFCCKALRHGLFAAGSGILSHPTQTEGLAALSTNLHRYLIGRTADAARFYLKYGHDVLKSFGENFERIETRLLFNNLECVVHDLLCDTLLAVKHDVIDELCYKLGIVKRIR